jgi:hypothetical protein
MFSSHFRFLSSLSYSVSLLFVELVPHYSIFNFFLSFIVPFHDRICHFTHEALNPVFSLIPLIRTLFLLYFLDAIHLLHNFVFPISVFLFFLELLLFLLLVFIDYFPRLFSLFHLFLQFLYLFLFNLLTKLSHEFDLIFSLIVEVCTLLLLSKLKLYVAHFLLFVYFVFECRIFFLFLFFLLLSIL